MKPLHDGFPEVRIGNQVWMTENLNVERFRNGDIIPEARTKKDWKRASTNQQPAWCYYDNDPSNGPHSGKLYNWYAVSDPRGLAPEGWHVPTDEEWTQLTDELGGGPEAGEKLKSTSGWEPILDFKTNGTNSSGFDGRPAGLRNNIRAEIFGRGEYGYWWSATQASSRIAWQRSMSHPLDGMHRGSSNKGSGFSIRCLRD